MLPSYLNSKPGDRTDELYHCLSVPPHHTLSYEGGEREPAAVAVGQPLGINTVRVGLVEEPGHHHEAQAEQEDGGDDDAPHLPKRESFRLPWLVFRAFLLT